MLQRLFNPGVVAPRVGPSRDEKAERLPAPEGKHGEGIAKLELVDLLHQHRTWVESREKAGERADLTNTFLPGADLSGVNLRGAFLRKASLTGADLSFADLRSSNLVHAGLEKANLLHTRLREAGLQGANLEGATGLLAEQLAGTSLFGAVLPKPLPDVLHQKLRTAMRASRTVRRLFAGMLLAAFVGVLSAATTTDAQIAGNAPVLPVPVIGRAFPAEGYFMLAPLFLLGLYLAFHVALLRHWEQLSELPAVFPDGQALDRRAQWPLISLVRHQSKWLSEDRLPPSPLHAVLLLLPAYWAVPAALLVFWGRYLTRLDLHASTFHAGLVAAAIIMAALLNATRHTAFRAESELPNPAERKRRTLGGVAVGASLGIVLFALSLGTVHGMPYGRPAHGADPASASQWAARILWLAGYDPYPNLSEAEISRKPTNWLGGDEHLPQVRGARLDGRSFRHADAFGAFFVNARLRGADLENATLAQADLRGALLQQANLRAAILDRAHMQGVEMHAANLERARLIGADVRRANLAFAVLNGAVLVDANLAKASLFAARLRAARMQGITLDDADLREADLAETNLNGASLRRAQLVSAILSGAELREARLQGATLLEADLQGADLRGAVLSGACLARATLAGAHIEGADLRDVACFSVQQLCSAPEWRKAHLDDPLRQQAEQQCVNRP